MFDSIEERIKQDADIEVSLKERVVKVLAIGTLSIVVFGGLYFAIRLIE